MVQYYRIGQFLIYLINFNVILSGFVKNHQKGGFLFFFGYGSS